MFVAFSHQVKVYSEDEVLQRGLVLLGYDVQVQGRVKRRTLLRRFKTHFGSHPLVISLCWIKLQTMLNYQARLPFCQTKPKNFRDFMMTQYYFKGYPVEESISSRFRVHEQTMRKWIHFFAKKLEALVSEYVVWPDSFDTTFIASVDC